MKEIKKVYGPYTTKSKSGGIYNRKTVQVHYVDGTKKTMLLSRHLMQEHLGRELSRDEEVDHKDGDKTNDALENLQVVPRSKHRKMDAKRSRKLPVPCVWCGEITYKNPRFMDQNARHGKAGPFCGPRCRGQYGAEVQNGRIKPLPTQPSGYTREYYQEKE